MYRMPSICLLCGSRWVEQAEDQTLVANAALSEDLKSLPVALRNWVTWSFAWNSKRIERQGTSPQLLAHSISAGSGFVFDDVVTDLSSESG